MKPIWPNHNAIDSIQSTAILMHPPPSPPPTDETTPSILCGAVRCVVSVFYCWIAMCLCFHCRGLLLRLARLRIHGAFCGAFRRSIWHISHPFHFVPDWCPLLFPAPSQPQGHRKGTRTGWTGERGRGPMREGEGGADSSQGGRRGGRGTRAREIATHKQDRRAQNGVDEGGMGWGRGDGTDPCCRGLVGAGATCWPAAAPGPVPRPLRSQPFGPPDPPPRVVGH